MRICLDISTGVLCLDIQANSHLLSYILYFHILLVPVALQSCIRSSITISLDLPMSRAPPLEVKSLWLREPNPKENRMHKNIFPFSITTQPSSPPYSRYHWRLGCYGEWKNIFVPKTLWTSALRTSWVLGSPPDTRGVRKNNLSWLQLLIILYEQSEYD